MARRAKLEIEVTGDGRGFERTMVQAERVAKKVGASIKNAFIGAFSAGAMIRFGRELLEQVQTIDKMAQKYNISTGEVQMLQDEAKRTHRTFEELVATSDKLEESLKRVHDAGSKPLLDPQSLQAIREFDKTLSSTKDKLKAGAGKDIAYTRNILGGGNLMDTLTGFGPVGVLRRMIFPGTGKRLDAELKDNEEMAANLERLEAEFRAKQRSRAANKAEMDRANAEADADVERITGRFTGKPEDEVPKDNRISELGGRGTGSSSDELARIGGFIGPGASNSTNVRILKQLEEIQRTLATRGIKINDTL